MKLFIKTDNENRIIRTQNSFFDGSTEMEISINDFNNLNSHECFIVDGLFKTGKPFNFDVLTETNNFNKISDLENKITPRNIRSAILGDQWAIEHITSIENQIASLRQSE